MSQGETSSNAGDEPKPVNVALQGGGSHGAFAWGVLDRLLEDGRLAIEAVSATSAGAMNAVALADGMASGGRSGARRKLEQLWQAISRAGERWDPGRYAPWLGGGGMRPPGAGPSLHYLWSQALLQVVSPYELNPFDINPLKDLLTDTIDFDRVGGSPLAPRLFLSATNVRTGKIKLFENAEITADVVLASACLPHLFKAVEIGGEHYWDGGFMGNPAIFPLIYHGASRDVVVVHVNPIVRPGLPRTAVEIRDRVHEITFNSSLMREMRAIAFVTRLIDEGALDGSRYRRMLIHSIRDEEEMLRHGIESKMSSDWGLLVHLRDAGRRAAAAWLERHAEDVGQRTSVDLTDLYL